MQLHFTRDTQEVLGERKRKGILTRLLKSVGEKRLREMDEAAIVVQEEEKGCEGFWRVCWGCW